ncbi:hypothetical protein [Methylobacterium sp. AMS5]|uniref:hypothetical protein n=1 Tax=Methylobacterium sp. AMS5 TaxID=925818 RepID=UPI00074F9B4C|nr:hypothetical protein [Methylobacterium sp. AMS5]AMB46187.1 hypothetical protein Y590_14780 [Methylobacterium sp. AMS5]
MSRISASREPSLPLHRGTLPATDATGSNRSAAGRKTAADPAATVQVSGKISEKAQAAADKLKADQEAAAVAARTFDEHLKARSDAFAAKLGTAFEREGIPLDEPIALRVESGTLVTDSPYRKKVEKVLKEDPELAKEFEAIASLKSMRAAQKSLELYNEEKKGARSRDEQDQAYGRYTTRMLDIQRLSGTMVLEDGAFTSAAEDYMAVMSGERISTSADPRKEVLKRYDSILQAAR